MNYNELPREEWKRREEEAKKAWHELGDAWLEALEEREDTWAIN